MKTSDYPSLFARSIAAEVRQMSLTVRLPEEDLSEAVRASGRLEDISAVNEAIAAALARLTASDIQGAIVRLSERLDSHPDSELPVPEDLVNSILVEATIQHLPEPVRSSLDGLGFTVSSDL